MDANLAATSSKPLEELALNLLFESYGEHRYNRSAEEYEYLSTLTENLKDVHFRVNKRLASVVCIAHQNIPVIRSDSLLNSVENGVRCSRR
jgi:hypothetical protein